MVTVQAPVESSVQLASTVPIVMSDEVSDTVPDGIFEAVVVSVTVTAHEPEAPTVNEAEQDTLVDVLSNVVTVTVIVAAVLVLPLSAVSPP